MLAFLPMYIYFILSQLNKEPIEHELLDMDKVKIELDKTEQIFINRQVEYIKYKSKEV